MEEIVEQSYRTMAGINQSSLKKILSSPYAYLKEINRTQESDESHFVFGSLVDDMLLAPKTVADKYYKMEASKTPDGIKSIVRYVYDMVREEEGTVSLEHDMMNDIILKGCEVYNWNSNWGAEAKLRNVKEKGLAYYHSLQQAEGKRVVPADEYNQAVLCKSALVADKYISKYLTPTADCTLYRHKVLSFMVAGEECKGEVDLVYINHKEKTIQPIDFKTTGVSLSGFNYEFWKYRYDFQCAFYTEGLQQDPEIKQLMSDGYQINNFQYIVVEKSLQSKPMIFTVPTEVVVIGRVGGELKNGRKLEGFVQAMKRLKFHRDQDLWDYPMEYYEQHGTLYIEL
jgi:hypothetical protein